AEWIATVVRLLQPAEQVSPSVSAAVLAQPRSPATASFDKKNPFDAAVIENIELTGRGSSKETRHIELSLADSGLTYQPGDALGVVARNDPVLVAALLDRLDLSADAPVTLKQRTIGLGEALGGAFEITAATPRFLDHWAEITGAKELHALRAADQAEARAAFLYGHHVLDIVNRFPAPGIEAERFVAGLRPLQPRLYSIASSPAATPDEAHITVSTVRYRLHDRPRTG